MTVPKVARNQQSGEYPSLPQPLSDAVDMVFNRLATRRTTCPNLTVSKIVEDTLAVFPEISLAQLKEGLQEVVFYIQKCFAQWESSHV